MQRLAVLLLPILLASCTHWVKDEKVLLDPVPVRDQLQIFTPAGDIRAHSVRVDSTTLSYVPYVMPPDCDSCRITLPRASVDSVRSSKLSVSRNVVLFASLFALGYALSGLPDDSGTY